jgi:hypothetical protein
MSKGLLLPVQIAILLLSGCAFWQGPAQAPVFTNATGAQSFLPDNAAFVDAGFESKAYDLAAAWNSILESRNGSNSARLDSADEAEWYARAALARSPGDAYAWLALAWSAELAGKRDEARVALETSWQWAPNSGNLSLLRSLLASHYWPDLPPESRILALRDMRLAHAGAKRDYQALMQKHPRFGLLDRFSRSLAARELNSSR